MTKMREPLFRDSTKLQIELNYSMIQISIYKSINESIKNFMVLFQFQHFEEKKLKLNHICNKLPVHKFL